VRRRAPRGPRREPRHEQGPEAIGDDGLGRARDLGLRPVGEDHGDGVVVGAEADAVLAHVIGDDRLAALFDQLGQGALGERRRVAARRLGREAHEERQVGRAARLHEAREQIGVRRERQHGRRTAVAVATRELPGDGGSGTKVRDGGRHDDDVGVDRRARQSLLKLGRGPDVDAVLDAERRRGRARPREQRHDGSARRGRRRRREAHLSRRAVAQKSHGVDRLLRRPRGDDDAPPDEIAGREDARRGEEDLLRLHEAPRADPPARERAAVRSDGVKPPRPVGAEQPAEVGLCERVLPHVDVHGGREQHGRARREHDGREQIIGQARGEPRDGVRRRGRDDHEVRVVREADVPDLRLLGGIEEALRHGVGRQRLHRQGRDEMRRRVRHDDPHARARLDEQPAELRRLVGRDPARDAQDDALARERAPVFRLRPCVHGVVVRWPRARPRGPELTPKPNRTPTVHAKRYKRARWQLRAGFRGGSTNMSCSNLWRGGAWASSTSRPRARAAWRSCA
jgi:hypothetical protein